MTAKMNVRTCARCREDHGEVTFTKMRYPMRDDEGNVTWTHWASCPTNGEPIMYVVTETPDAPTEEPERAEEQKDACVACGSTNIVETDRFTRGTHTCRGCGAQIWKGWI